jgi:protein involved in polysaccharide export with SLBB domain
MRLRLIVAALLLLAGSVCRTRAAGPAAETSGPPDSVVRPLPRDFIQSLLNERERPAGLLVVDEKPRAAAVPAADLPLRPGDRLRFSVQEDPEATAEIVVNASGKGDFPLLGLWVVAGRTVEQIAAEARTALEAEFLVRATVRLLLVERPEKSSSRGRVYLAGQMRKIGVVEIDLSESNTAGRVILASGGLSDFADAKRIRIVRKVAGRADLETLTVDLEEVLKKGRIDRDVPLLDGDFVIADAKLVNW